MFKLFGESRANNVLLCKKVTVDTILIESDMEAKAILDLIPILNIRKLVLYTTKSNLRYNITPFNHQLLKLLFHFLSIIIRFQPFSIVKYCVLIIYYTRSF